MQLRLPRTIRMDTTDPLVFGTGEAAEPGEFAVTGAFEFLAEEPAALTGKRRQAFANGFLGTGSFGWSTFVAVASVDAARYRAVVEALARRFVERHGAPSLEVARPVAAEEVAFAAALCQDHPVNTLLALSRFVDDSGAICEQVRVVEPRGERPHTAIWDIVAEEEEVPGESVDLVALATGKGRG